jgi:hypothetical protein
MIMPHLSDAFHLHTNAPPQRLPPELPDGRPELLWSLQVSDVISSCIIGLFNSLYGGYYNSILEDNILEDNNLGHHIRLASYHMLIVLASYKYITSNPQIDMTLCEK